MPIYVLIRICIRVWGPLICWLWSRTWGKIVLCLSVLAIWLYPAVVAELKPHPAPQTETQRLAAVRGQEEYDQLAYHAKFLDGRQVKTETGSADWDKALKALENFHP